MNSADIVRMGLLLGLLGLCTWSAYDSFFTKTSIGSTNSPVGSLNGIRKLDPDFSVCGNGDISTPSYKDDKRSKCSAIVRDATINAQTLCVDYLQNEADCRQERNSRCSAQTDNVEGCTRLVVIAALSDAGLQIKG